MTVRAVLTVKNALVRQGLKIVFGCKNITQQLVLVHLALIWRCHTVMPSNLVVVQVPGI